MDFSGIFSAAVPDIQKLQNFGFTQKSENSFEYSQSLKRFDMNIVFAVDCAEKSFTAKAFDSFNEEYTLLDVKKANGSFVSELRAIILSIKEKIVISCFESTSLKQKVLDYVKEAHGTEPVNPWKEDTGTTLNCPNKKWYGLLMTIPLKKLTGTSDQLVDVLNVKLDPEVIAFVTDNKNVFPAWHMNKKYWVTILLNQDIPFEKVVSMLEMSWDLVNK